MQHWFKPQLSEHFNHSELPHHGHLASHISTTDYPDDATPIANIKNILNQGKGVHFGFSLADSTDWNGFKTFWVNQSETTIWDPDVYCGHTWSQFGGSGSHAVLIVGYDDSSADPTQHYWIVLNSWGTTAGRPNGLFRMKMHMNYNCIMHDVSMGDWFSRQFMTLNMTFNEWLNFAWHTFYGSSNQDQAEGIAMDGQ